jgi:hypothetical protein
MKGKHLSSGRNRAQKHRSTISLACGWKSLKPTLPPLAEQLTYREWQATTPQARNAKTWRRKQRTLRSWCQMPHAERA